MRSIHPSRSSHSCAVPMSVNTTSSSSAFDALPSGVKIAATSISWGRPAMRTAIRSPGFTPSAVAVLAPKRTLSGAVNKAAIPFWRGVPAALISGRNASSLNGSIPKIVSVRDGFCAVMAYPSSTGALALIPASVRSRTKNSSGMPCGPPSSCSVALPLTAWVDERNARRALSLAMSMAITTATPIATPMMASRACQGRRSGQRRVLFHNTGITAASRRRLQRDAPPGCGPHGQRWQRLRGCASPSATHARAGVPGLSAAAG